MITLTLTPKAVEYLSMLCDIDDDPENAISAGIDFETWESTRSLVIAAGVGS